MTGGLYMPNTTRAQMQQACTEAITALIYEYSEQVPVKGKKPREVTFPGLLEQLRTKAADPYASKQGGPTNNPNKSISRPPLNQAMADLVDSVDEQADRILQWLRTSVTVAEQPGRQQKRGPESKLREIDVMCGSSMLQDAQLATILQSMTAMVSRAREMLGHESRRVMLGEMVCGECGGGLSVAEDASTDVECMGTPTKAACGNSYARTSWLDFMRQGGA